MAIKERVKPLLAIAAEDKPQELRSAAAKALKEIDGDIKALNKDKATIKDIVERFGGSEDLLDSRGRSAKVREAAIALAESGGEPFAPSDVIKYLDESEGLKLDVAKPASVAGTILAQLVEKGEFERFDDGRFKYVGNHSADANGTGAD